MLKKRRLDCMVMVRVIKRSTDDRVMRDITRTQTKQETNNTNEYRVI
jgi:hypothetical protein